MTDNSFNFEWNSKEYDFKSWMFLSIVSKTAAAQDHRQEFYDKLKQATDSFKDVQITIQANGIELDAQGFFERLQEVMDEKVGREAVNLITSTPSLTRLQDMMYDLEQSMRDVNDEIRHNVRTVLQENGLRVPEDFEG